MTQSGARIMDILKEATAEQHRDAEGRRLQRDMVGGRLTTATYAEWLGQMLLLHRALWEEIERRGGECQALVDVVRDGGSHVSNLRADLTRLNVDSHHITPLPATKLAIEVIRRTADEHSLALLGYNYVLEGSMNGNRFIARALERTLDVPAVSYLDPYGEEQRPTWLAYRQRMDDIGVDAEQTDRLVSAARDMFRFIAEMSDAVAAREVPAQDAGSMR